VTYEEDDLKSLDVVQRWVISALVIVVGGAPTAALAAYSASLRLSDHTSAVGLWVMSCVIGLLTMVAVLVIHRRFPLHPLVFLGLLPGAISAYHLF
jgi:hypothetical protein